MFQKRKTILYFVFFALFLGVYLFCFPHQIQAKSMDTKGYYSKSFALMDGYSGRILGGKEEELPLANASTTKILTCILLLENGELTDYFTASPRAARQPKVHLGIKAEQAYNIQDMLYCLMLESFNDCAVLLAEYLSGSVEAFAVKMNEKAKEIGCTDTYFITPNGLDDQDERSFHHTTSKDLCRIMRYCVWESPQKEKFLNDLLTRY